MLCILETCDPKTAGGSDQIVPSNLTKVAIFSFTATLSSYLVYYLSFLYTGLQYRVGTRVESSFRLSTYVAVPGQTVATVGTFPFVFLFERESRYRQRICSHLPHRLKGSVSGFFGPTGSTEGTYALKTSPAASGRAARGSSAYENWRSRVYRRSAQSRCRFSGHTVAGTL